MSDLPKAFDAVEWMRARREEADEEIRRWGWEEFSRRTLERLKNDPLWARLEQRVMSPTAMPFDESRRTTS